MQRLVFKQTIAASIYHVYQTMLGLLNKKTYESWTSIFNPTSTYEGDWTEGSKMLFIGYDEHGKKGGMISEITTHQHAQIVSIRHYGMLDGEQEITSGPTVEPWINSYEIYEFTNDNGLTTVSVSLDTSEDFIGYFQEKYPQALLQLQKICE